MQNIQMPALDVQVLDETEVALVSGGMYANEELSDGCSCTVSQCHMDGVTDSD